MQDDDALTNMSKENQKIQELTIKHYKMGWNEAIKHASNIALSIDSNRGNEKEISKACLATLKE